MVHLFQNNGFYIVLDGNSGSVHDVDEVAYDIIGMYENTPREEIIAKITSKYNDVTAADVEEVFDDIETLK